MPDLRISGVSMFLKIGSAVVSFSSKTQNSPKSIKSSGTPVGDACDRQ